MRGDDRAFVDGGRSRLSRPEDRIASLDVLAAYGADIFRACSAKRPDLFGEATQLRVRPRHARGARRQTFSYRDRHMTVRGRAHRCRTAQRFVGWYEAVEPGHAGFGCRRGIVDGRHRLLT